MLDNKIYLIKSAGRCGSNLVVEHFETVGYHLCFTHGKNIPPENKKIIVHDHTIEYLPSDLQSTYCFLVRRKDIKKQAMSWAVVSYLRQALENIPNRDKNVYNAQKDFSKSIDKMIFPKNEFKELIKKINHYNQNAEKIIQKNNVPYEILWYEDFIKNPSYFDKFTSRKLNRKTFDMQPSKTNAKDLILNYNDLMNLD